MDAVLLDSDVFSYLARANDLRGDAYRPHVRFTVHYPNRVTRATII